MNKLFGNLRYGPRWGEDIEVLGGGGKRLYALVRSRDSVALAFHHTRSEMEPMRDTFIRLGVPCRILCRSQGGNGWWTKDGQFHEQK